MLSHVWLFVTPWTSARQASLSFSISQSLLKLMSSESVMSSHPLSEENQRIINHKKKKPNTNPVSEEYNDRTEHSIKSFNSRLKPMKESINSKAWHFSQKDKQREKQNDKMGCLSYWLKWCIMGQFWVTDNFLTRIVITQVYSLLIISAVKLEFVFWS